LSEAVHLGLPVVTFDNAWTMPQERYNARWVRAHGLGQVVRTLRDLPAAVQALTADLDAARARVAATENRAIDEVLDIVAGMLAGHGGPADRRRGVQALSAAG
jgi:UDP-N-acetylglucosamine:LPS N-acetylglucosamine transferase